MIISASRRTDIPAFFTEWLLKRLNDGYVYVKNPFNRNQIHNIILSPDVVDCIVFWTKNPLNILKKLNDIDSLGYKYYFQFTLTNYSKEIEKNVPDRKEIINTFKTLSESIGHEKVVWRYDPIFLTKKNDKKYHANSFNYIAKQLKGYTKKCVISFIDYYKKCENNLKNLNITDLREIEQIELIRILKEIATNNDIIIETCAEKIDLSKLNINHGKCIDDKLIAEIIEKNLIIEKDKSQRKECRCVSSIDIGEYNTCKHNCLYCYANYSQKSVKKRILEHDKNSPLLIGHLKGNEKIFDRKMVSYKSKQLKLF